jgi:hypothetical protein
MSSPMLIPEATHTVAAEPSGAAVRAGKDAGRATLQRDTRIGTCEPKRLDKHVRTGIGGPP